MTVTAAFAGMIAGVTLASLVGVAAAATTSVVWLIIIQPDHTNDIEWQMSSRQMLAVASTTIVSATIASRLFHRLASQLRRSFARTDRPPPGGGVSKSPMSTYDSLVDAGEPQ